MYPVTDYEFDSASMIDNAKGYFLEADSMRWFYEHYARTTPTSPTGVSRRCARPISPGSRRAVVITAEYDPLRDQGEAYGRALAATRGCPTRSCAPTA